MTENNFENELKYLGCTDNEIKIIKSLIVKYAPKERPNDNTYFIEGWNNYKAELFNNLQIKEN